LYVVLGSAEKQFSKLMQFPLYSLKPLKPLNLEGGTNISRGVKIFQ